MLAYAGAARALLSLVASQEIVTLESAGMDLCAIQLSGQPGAGPRSRRPLWCCLDVRLSVHFLFELPAAAQRR